MSYESSVKYDSNILPTTIEIEDLLRGSVQMPLPVQPEVEPPVEVKPPVEI